jgi:hypothetical protein
MPVTGRKAARLFADPRTLARHPNRRRRNPGVMLTGRPAGRCDIVVTGDGGKAKLHRTARRVEGRRWRAEAAAELAEGGER